MKRFHLSVLCCLMFSGWAAADPNSLEFLESFAWGDREAALQMLTPNTEEFFYYRALHLQLSGDRVGLESHMRQWLAFFNQRGTSPHYQKINRRQRLIEFMTHPEAAWKLIQDETGIVFYHTRPGEAWAPTDSSVDPVRYALSTFNEIARQHGHFPAYTDRGLHLLADATLSGEFRRLLLGRVQFPDYPGLVDLILADLDFRDSRGFGSLPIHQALTREQLEELARRRPALLRDGAYIAARLARFPAPDVDLERNSSEAVVYFQGLWTFVKTLDPMHNSLKAAILYQILSHQRRLNVYDESLFRAYIELPRQVAYVPRDRLDQLRRTHTEWVNFNYRLSGSIALPPIGNEEPLIREFLIELFRTASSPAAYEAWFESAWLNAIFAESKILHGIGKPEDQASRLSPAQYRAILDRIELDFAPQNRSYQRPGEAVELVVDVKRMDRVRVNVYELHTFNYYTTHRAAVDQAVELDGLVATHTREIHTAAPPGRRIRHTIGIPEITERGVYVVELIGGGVSSRALLHIGQLEAVSQSVAGGQAVMVFNEQGEHVPGASVWLDGREFSASPPGIVLLPFSEAPGFRFIVLRDGDFSSPDQIFHVGENYAFDAGIHLDAQNLPRRTTARLILRPDFRINGLPLDPARLGEVKIALGSTDARGVRTERLFTATFERDSEWTRDFYVPDDARRFDVTATARLRRQIDNEEITLSSRFNLDVNGARAADTLRQAFLLPSQNGWRLEVRGLNGEPISGLSLFFEFHHPAFTVQAGAVATTDDAGRVDLGTLEGLSRVRVYDASGTLLNHDIVPGMAALPGILHVQAGDAVSLPYPFPVSGLGNAATLLRVYRDTVQDILNDRVAIAEGELKIAPLEAGEYRLHIHETGQRVVIQVGGGSARHGFLFEPRRRLQQTVARMPSVRFVSVTDNTLRVEVRNLTPSTRLAVRAARYAGAGADFPGGLGFTDPSARIIEYPYSLFVSGRNIGDEYRYVLERRDQPFFAGSLLARPGLILNPWEVRETTAERERLETGEAYRGRRATLAAPAAPGEAAAMRERRAPPPVSVDIGFDFLEQGSVWWVNVKPNDDGVVELSLDGLKEQTFLDVLVLDRFGTSRSMVLLPDRPFSPRTVHLDAGLDPDRSFSRQKTIRSLAAGETVTFDDLATTRYQTIRAFSEAFDLLNTLGENSPLTPFAFLKEWPKLDRDARLAKYGEFASHELHLFLYHRDRPFFDEIVRPYLLNKKDKTFVDRWLLDELTAGDTAPEGLRRRNAMELALLARRGGNAEQIRVALREQHELIPRDPEAFARLLRVILQAADLNEEVAQARLAAREKAEEALDRTPRRIERLAAPGAPPQAAAVPFDAARKESGAVMVEMKAADQLQRADGEARRLSMGLDESVIVPGEDRAAGVGAGVHFGDAMELAEMELGDAGVLFRALPRTKELAEHNYYRIRESDDTPKRVPVNAFWRDVAEGLELSSNLFEAHTSLTESLVALALCGLPWDADEAVETPEGAAMTLKAAGPLLLATEQILPAEASRDDRPVLVSQQVFRPDDQYRYEGGEQIEKYVTGEFVRRVVYGARVTLTNPTSSRRRLNVLMQIPLGAIPVRNGFYTDDRFVDLDPYTTQTIEFYFTFPFAGSFIQFPAHAADAERIVGQAEPRVFEVVDSPTEEDRGSWTWISRYGSADDVLTYLDTHNPRRINLDDILWRLRDRDTFVRVTDLLAARLVYHDTTWSYAVYHRDAERARVWLSESWYANRVGPVFESPLLTVDPVERKTYEHLEYDPLANPRAHSIGERRVILNPAVNQQYRAFLETAAYRGTLNARERLALVYYLLLQDRIEEANAQLAAVDGDELHERLQSDYLRAWLALRSLEFDRALALIEPHLGHPVPRWRARFEAARELVAASRGAGAADPGDPDRTQTLDRAAGDSPALEMKQEGGRILVNAHNLPRATLNLYPMDIELLFSRRPFQTAEGGGFGMVKPAFSKEIDLPADGAEFEIVLPESFRDGNLVVELAGRGLRESVTRYANRMRVRVMQSFGQIEVRSADNGDPLPRTYIKVYAQGADGRESFWKDGYTDPRGRFDYLSLNDREPEEAVRFAILVLHTDYGATIRETTPPLR